MKYDLRALDPEEFETFCGALLKAKGFRVRRFASRGQPDRGIDYLAESRHDDTLYVVQVKRFSRNQVPMSDLRRVLLDLNESDYLCRGADGTVHDNREGSNLGYR